MALNIFKTPEELAEALAQKILATARQCIKSSGRFNFVLTGGSSPVKLYQLLSTRHKEEVNWQKVYFFIGDERYVPATDKDYNGRMATETLLNPLNIPSSNIFLVDTGLRPEAAAADYFGRIKEHFNGQLPVFDLIVLGMGDDGHTASLSPGTAILKSQHAAVEAVFVDKLNSWRISFTAKLINQANEIAFLVSGAAKADAFHHVQMKKESADTYPARLIKGNVSWYMDESVVNPWPV